MPKKSLQTDGNRREDASIMALNLLAFIATDEDRLNAFCNQTGLGAGELRDSLGEPGFQAMALDYALQNEELLIAFADHQGVAPQLVVAARRHLPGFVE